ncbi:uncharacterized protein [Primulina huaijiensis]|uniref:uncharacterized protein n=1 Tax=Primulina huaijiensis TaxID=1492673 RepID=UPI003CC6F626
MTSSSTTPHPTIAQGEKPEKFSGADFKRWQQKMLFYLTTMSLSRFLKEDPPPVAENETDTNMRAALDAWIQSDFLCKNYILNGLDNALYNVYCKVKTAKELWDMLDKKYRAEDAGLKKFIVGRFLDFKMVDSKSVMSQVQELQLILHEIHAEGMSLSESFQVAALIEKLPPLWKDFKNYLKYKRKEMGLEELIVRLRIEEDNKRTEAKASKMAARVNIVESSFKGKKRNFEKQPQQGQQPPNKKKFKGTCYNCEKPNHMAKDCRKPKKGNPQANVVQERSVPFDFSELDLSAVILEANLVENPNEGWVDTGATRHICSNKKLFSTYTPSTERKLYMGNSATSEVVGTGNVVLNMTSGLEVTLVDALHVPDIRKNLVSGSLLVKRGFRLVFESNKVVLTKNGHFIGKGYLDENLFKLNVMAIRQNVVEKRKENGSSKRKLETEHAGQVPTHEPTLNENATPLESSSKEQEQRRSKRARISKSFGPDFHTFMLENEPKDIQDALASPEAPYWKEAINSEMDSILQNHTWELVDLPPGIKIFRTPESIIPSQSHYVETVLKRFNVYDSTPVKTPLDVNVNLTKNRGEPVSQLEYSRIIGSLMYITNCTRPDIACAVNKLSRFTSNPSDAHWKELTRDSKSTSGYVFTIGGGAVSWRSSKQTCIARSTMESEFIALDRAAEEAEWLRNFLEDIPCWTSPVPAILIHCDNQSAIARAQNSMYNGKSRHICRRHNTVRQLISNGVISVDYIKSKDNLADPLTKALNRDQMYCLSRGMGLKPTKESFHSGNPTLLIGDPKILVQWENYIMRRGITPPS